MAREAVIRKVRPYELHGTSYYQLLFSYINEPEAAHEARIASDAIYADPKEGDAILVEAIVGIVTSVRRKEPQAT